MLQTLARHSDINLTLKRYTHANLHDLGSAVAKMEFPTLEFNPTIVELRATGTDDAPALLSMAGSHQSSVVPIVAPHSAKTCHPLRTPDDFGPKAGPAEKSCPEKQKALQMRGSEGDCQSLTSSGEGGIL